MIQLDLTPEEARILTEILDSAISDLRMEISHTDSQDYREMLKVRKGVLRKTLDAFGVT